MDDLLAGGDQAGAARLVRETGLDEGHCVLAKEDGTIIDASHIEIHRKQAAVALVDNGFEEDVHLHRWARAALLRHGKVKEAAEEIGRTRATLYNWIKAGKLGAGFERFVA